LKRTNWYAFGLPPNVVAEKVAEHVSSVSTKHIALGDYSRMDGTVNHLVREFDVAFLRGNFHERDHAEILTWYQQTYDNSVSAGYGVHYDQGASQASGDPYTSALNTARNAFISFCCLYNTFAPNCKGKLDAGGAYAHLGLMAGDDSIQRNLDEKHSIKVAAEWGFVLKFNIAERGQRVDFLARNYSPSVWEGCPDNVCSPLRTISKFHVSTLTDTISKNVIAHSKAQSLLANDSLTYIFGDYFRKVVKQTAEEYAHWCKTSRKTKVALLETDKQWNDKLAQSFGDIRETSYQSGNTCDDDWQRTLFLEAFQPERIAEFEAYVADPDSSWDDPPCLAEFDAKPAAEPYLGNGVLVDPSPSDEKPIIVPIPPVKAKQPDPEQSESKSKPPSKVFTCKRGENTSGWYSRCTKPCHTPVKELGGHCDVCSQIFRDERKRRKAAGVALLSKKEAPKSK